MNRDESQLEPHKKYVFVYELYIPKRQKKKNVELALASTFVQHNFSVQEIEYKEEKTRYKIIIFNATQSTDVQVSQLCVAEGWKVLIFWFAAQYDGPSFEQTFKPAVVVEEKASAISVFHPKRSTIAKTKPFQHAVKPTISKTKIK